MGAFDLVMVATAFHWLDPATRLHKCAAALRPGGALAIVETHWGAGPTRDRFSVDVQVCYERWDRGNAPNFLPPTVDTMPERHAELDGSALFGPAVLRRYSVPHRYTTAQYRDLMQTWSTVRTLDPASRSGLLDCVGALIDREFSGVVSRYDTYSCWLARLAL